MASPVYVQPDLEALVHERLALPGVTSWAAASLADYPVWHYRYTIQVDARAGRKADARERAFAAQYLMLALPDAAWADGVITYVQPVAGPFWLPDDDGAPRYTAQYEVRCHPRTATAPQQWAAPLRRTAA